MSFNITILGSNSALPTSKRNSTAQLLNINERFFLLDCGEGTQIQLRKYKINFSKINHIFISHLHGDHSFGLFGLISSFGLLGRKNKLHIYSDKKLESIVRFILEQYNNSLSFEIEFHYLYYKEDSIIFEDDKIIISSFPLKHRIPTCGFLFKEKKKLRNIKKDAIEEFNIPIRERIKIQKGEDYIVKSGEIVKNSQITLPPYKPRSYAFVSDTLPLERIIPVIRNVDILYHEATFLQTDKLIAKKTFHSTASQAANIAKSANVDKLLLGHFSARYKNLGPLLQEAKQIFENTCLSNDGDSFSVKLKREKFI